RPSGRVVGEGRRTAELAPPHAVDRRALPRARGPARRGARAGQTHPRHASGLSSRRDPLRFPVRATRRRSAPTQHEAARVSAAAAEAPPRNPTVRTAVSGGSLEVVLAGDWILENELTSIDALRGPLTQSPRLTSIRFDTRALGAWDSGLVMRLIALHRDATAHDIAFDDSGLPHGAPRLIAPAAARKAREGAARTQKRRSFIAQLGEQTLATWNAIVAFVAFVGQAALSVGRFARGRAKYLRSDVVQHVQEAGVAALPIVSLISFLIGMIFA